MPLRHAMLGVLQLWAQDVEQSSSCTDLRLQGIRGSGHGGSCADRTGNAVQAAQCGPQQWVTAKAIRDSRSVARQLQGSVYTHALQAVPLQQVLAQPRCQQPGHGTAPTCRSGAASSSARGHTVSSSLTTILLATSRDTFCRAPAAEPHTAQLCDLHSQGAGPSRKAMPDVVYRAGWTEAKGIWRWPI